MRRELHVAGRANPVIIEQTYTIKEAAAALGKSLANFRRWVTSELVPPPFLKDTERGWFCYSREELDIMRTVLAEHEREFTYFCASHTNTINRLHQQIHGYRDITFGRELTRTRPSR